MKTQIKNLMPKVISALGDLASNVEYHTSGSLQYDTITGSTNEIGKIVTSTRCVVTEFTQEERTNAQLKSNVEIQTTDKKVLIPSVFLPNITPKISDYLVLNSMTYKVVDFDIDPAEAMWQLHVRV